MSLPSFPSPGAWRPIKSSSLATRRTVPDAGPSVTRRSTESSGTDGVGTGVGSPAPVGGGAFVGASADGASAGGAAAGGAGGSGSGGGPGGGGGGGGGGSGAGGGHG